MQRRFPARILSGNIRDRKRCVLCLKRGPDGSMLNAEESADRFWESGSGLSLWLDYPPLEVRVINMTWSQEASEGLQTLVSRSQTTENHRDCVQWERLKNRINKFILQVYSADSFILLTQSTWLKGQFPSKMKILSSFTQVHIVSFWWYTQIRDVTVWTFLITIIVNIFIMVNRFTKFCV